MHVVTMLWLLLSRFGTLHECDRQTDRQNCRSNTTRYRVQASTIKYYTGGVVLTARRCLPLPPASMHSAVCRSLVQCNASDTVVRRSATLWILRKSGNGGALWRESYGVASGMIGLVKDTNEMQEVGLQDKKILCPVVSSSSFTERVS